MLIHQSLFRDSYVCHLCLTLRHSENTEGAFVNHFHSRCRYNPQYPGCTFGVFSHR